MDMATLAMSSSKRERAAAGDEMAGGRWRAPLLLLTPLVLLMVASFFFVETDPDYWWHLRTGRLIVETRAVPHTDSYSFTARGQPWVTQEWLTEVLLYTVQRVAGYAGNVALFGVIGAGAALLVYATCRRRGLGEPAAALLMCWSFALGFRLANVRPQLITALLLAASAYLLTRYRQGARWALWPFPPLLLLWVNLHGGFIIGLGLLGLTLAGETIAKLRRRDHAPLTPLLAVTLASSAATLLNPGGPATLLYPLTYASGTNASSRYVLEWQSPNFHDRGMLVFAFSLALGLALGIAARPLGPTDLLWALTFALLGLQSTRHVPLYGIIVTPLLGARLLAVAPGLGRPLARWRRPGSLAITWALIPLIVLAGAKATAEGQPLQWGREPSPAGYPVAAADYLAGHELAGNLFNQYRWGGYLIYRLYPRYPVYVDGRADPFSDRVIDDYRAITRLDPGWQALLGRYGVALAVIENESPLAGAPRADPTWRELARGDVDALFARATAAVPPAHTLNQRAP